MGKHEINNRIANGNLSDEKIVEVSRSILSYCMSCTSSQHDAEDLSQDILLELVRSLPNIRDEKAFYKFMWAVADNVYKQWYARKAKGW